MIFSSVINILPTYHLTALVPVAQLLPQDGSFYEQLSSSFRQGLDPGPVYVGIIVLTSLMILLYVFLRLMSGLFSGSAPKKKKFNILESIQSNLRLSDKQERYLDALIEKFKNRASYEPEVSTDYMRDFLFYAIQNLTYAPKRKIRRKTHYVPDFEIGSTLDLMLQVEEDTYTTLRAEIVEQDEEIVNIKKPSATEVPEFHQDQSIDTAYNKGDLILRGEARIKAISDGNLALEYPLGMHFEEQRTYDRVKVNDLDCQLILQEWEGETIRVEGTVTDLSVGGAKIHVPIKDNRIIENMRGRVQFKNEQSLNIDLEIVVIHREHDEDGYSLGVEFIDPGMTNRNLLEQFLTDRKSAENET